MNRYVWRAAFKEEAGSEWRSVGGKLFQTEGQRKEMIFHRMFLCLHDDDDNDNKNYNKNNKNNSHHRYNNNVALMTIAIITTRIKLK